MLDDADTIGLIVTLLAVGALFVAAKRDKLSKQP